MNKEVNLSADQEKVIIDKMVNATKKYCTPLVSPIELPITAETQPGVGSAAFVQIGNIKGILTAEHVALPVIGRNNSVIHIPHPTNYKLLPLGFIPPIITMPIPFKTHLSGAEPALTAAFQEYLLDADLAFIPLNEMAIREVEMIGKKFWNVDLNISSLKMSDNTPRNKAWVIHACVVDGWGLEPEISSEIPVISFPKSGPCIVVPNLKWRVFKSYTHQEGEYVMDILICPINTKAEIPESFRGISGGALWEILFDPLTSEIQEVILIGMANQENKNYGKIQSILCRGPVSIYQSFIPHCKKELKTR